MTTKGKYGEPWTFENKGSSVCRIHSENQMIGICSVPDHNLRVIACVNALDGIPDPAAAINAAREALTLIDKVGPLSGGAAWNSYVEEVLRPALRELGCNP